MLNTIYNNNKYNLPLLSAARVKSCTKQNTGFLSFNPLKNSMGHDHCCSHLRIEN